MFCPACGTQNASQVRFCRQCGKQLPLTGTLPQQPANDDPFQTRLAIPVEQASLKQQLQNAQNNPPAPPPPDPFATMVAMPAAKIGTPPTPPPQQTAQPTQPGDPDPFATQVSPSFNAADLQKELAKQKGAPPPQPPAGGPDPLKTVVGMQAVPPELIAAAKGIKPPEPEIDYNKTVVAGMPAVQIPPKPTPPANPSIDDMATVKSMPAIPKTPEQKAEEAPKPVETKAPEAKKLEPEQPKVAAAAANSNAPFAKQDVPANYDPFKSMSNAGTGESTSNSKMIIIGLVIGVILVILIAIGFMMTRPS